METLVNFYSTEWEDLADSGWITTKVNEEGVATMYLPVRG